MRSIDDFVKRNFYGLPKTFKQQREAYEKLTIEIAELIEKKKVYDDLLIKDDSISNGMSFKDKLNLYKSIKADDYLLKGKFLDMYDDLNDYIELNNRLMELKSERSNIISENISFMNFGIHDHFDEKCMETSHCLIKIEDDLICAYCGATTKEYSMSKEDFEFLTYCAECKGILLKEVSKEDLPLLKVLIEENNYYRSQRVPLDEIEEDGNMSYLDWAEEYYLDDSSEIPEIKRKIRQAHILDSKKYLDKNGLSEEDAKKSYLQLVQEWKINDVAVSEPCYLSGKRLEQFQKQLAEKLNKIEQSNDNNRALLLEEYMIMKYELSILTGISIPELLASTTTETEKSALTKAYFILSSQIGRKNSGFFENENDALRYDCITANPEINQRILEMKFKKN